MKFISRITSVLGFGQRATVKQGAPTGDVGTQLAHQRTDLAMERNYLAAERTLMAWIRTSLSMISFGFTIGKLGQVVGAVEVKGVFGRTKMMGVESVAYYLVVLGTLVLIGAALQHRHRMRELYAMGLHRQISLSFIVSLVLAVLGFLAFGALLLAL